MGLTTAAFLITAFPLAPPVCLHYDDGGAIGVLVMFKAPAATQFKMYPPLAIPLVDNAVVGALVSVKRSDGRAAMALRTDSSGQACFPLPPGVYSIAVSADGFTQVALRRVDVAKGALVKLSIPMRVRAKPPTPATPIPAGDANPR